MRLRNPPGCFFFALGLGAALAGAAPAAADSEEDCFSTDTERRISGCTDLIDRNALDPGDMSLAYSLRALAFSLKGQFERAIRDYDASIQLDPDSATALNNRAWAYFKSGAPEKGEEDVARSLAIEPESPYSLDTRAHIAQSLGDTESALKDYQRAINAGGEKIIKLYQCGLQAQGLYSGDVDGFFSRDVRKALESCVANPKCDPLPADEECRKVTS